ncbi:hypothetical protein JTE90_023321 [Oedothorax gibbosus]|uniref:Uncharacterized protein n=1 Tax=Oedothorax gibbosus TaxID=931172 RepID=A0AAV6VGQ2_9ARAC|nr:hypothetical protein JTE90_023321 [Oedothorax gibbosus]
MWDLYKCFSYENTFFEQPAIKRVLLDNFWHDDNPSQTTTDAVNEKTTGAVNEETTEATPAEDILHIRVELNQGRIIKDEKPPVKATPTSTTAAVNTKPAKATPDQDILHIRVEHTGGIFYHASSIQLALFAIAIILLLSVIIAFYWKKNISNHQTNEEYELQDENFLPAGNTSEQHEIKGSEPSELPIFDHLQNIANEMKNQGNEDAETYLTDEFFQRIIDFADDEEKIKYLRCFTPDHLLKMSKLYYEEDHGDSKNVNINLKVRVIRNDSNDEN